MVKALDLKLALSVYYRAAVHPKVRTVLHATHLRRLLCALLRVDNMIR